MAFFSESAAIKSDSIPGVILFAQSLGANSQHGTFPRERFSVAWCAMNVVRAIVLAATGFSDATIRHRFRWSLHNAGKFTKVCSRLTSTAIGRIKPRRFCQRYEFNREIPK